MDITYIKGDLIELAKEGKFDIIVHGCNCFSRMRRGIAPQMAEAFGCDQFPAEKRQIGDYNKLGTIDFRRMEDLNLLVVNAYTQFHSSEPSPVYQIPLDYDALRLCMRKITMQFGVIGLPCTIGLPKIGCGLAGGDWNIVEQILKEELSLFQIIVVEYEKH